MVERKTSVFVDTKFTYLLPLYLKIKLISLIFNNNIKILFKSNRISNTSEYRFINGCKSHHEHTYMIRFYDKIDIYTF